MRLIDALQLMDRKQSIVEDTHGNVSYRHNDTFTIKPSGMEYGEITTGDLVSVDLRDGTVYGRRKPSVDADHHRSIYMRNPQVGSICHTHSPYATAWAISGHSMLVRCTEHADYFGHPIRCLPFASLDQWGWIELREGEQAVLLGKHGVLICCRDRDPVSAVKLAVALEAIAKKYTVAKSIGALQEPLSEYETKKWHDRYQNRYGQ